MEAHLAAQHLLKPNGMEHARTSKRNPDRVVCPRPECGTLLAEVRSHEVEGKTLRLLIFPKHWKQWGGRWQLSRRRVSKEERGYRPPTRRRENLDLQVYHGIDKLPVDEGRDYWASSIPTRAVCPSCGQEYILDPAELGCTIDREDRRALMDTE